MDGHGFYTAVMAAALHERYDEGMAKTHKLKTKHPVSRKTPALDEGARAVVPDTMRAAVLARFGGPEAIELRELPVPRPGPHEALIHVVAAGVGVWDAKLKSGEWGRETKPPITLGADGSGVVVAVGPRTRGLKVGDEVWASSYMNPKGGFHAEYVCVSEDAAAKKPRRLTLDQAGAIAATGLTALQGVELLEIEAGDAILIFGATGGVGSLAVQFAKLKGADVIATGSGGRLEYVHSIGADAGFDPRQEGAKGLERALKALGKERLDGVLALAGGDVLQACVERLAPGGKLAYPNGVMPEPRGSKDVALFSFNGESSPENFEALNEAVERCPEFEARIDASFAFEDAAQAYERVGRGGVLGRVIIRVDERRLIESRGSARRRPEADAGARPSPKARRPASAGPRRRPGPSKRRPRRGLS